MGRSVSFDIYVIETFLQEVEQAEDYLKQALEEGDLELLKLTVENLIQAGYGSFKVASTEAIEINNIQLERQKPATIEITFSPTVNSQTER